MWIWWELSVESWDSKDSIKSNKWIMPQKKSYKKFCNSQP